MELLLFYFLTLAGITCCVEEPPVTKIIVIEDEDVILPCSFGSTNIQSDTFDWRKDDQKEVFLYSAGSHYNNGRPGQDPQFKGRVFHFEDQPGVASIVIRNTKKTDSGRYSCIFPFHQQRTRSITELIVVTKMIVIEDEDVILPCSLDSTNIRSETFDWKKDDQRAFMYAQGTHSNNGREDQDPQFKGRVFHFEDQLQSGNASIEIRNTKVTDSGRYSCIFPFHQPTTRSITELIVGAAPEPVITLHPVNEGVLLQCEVRGAPPKPKVVWKDGAGNILPAEEPVVTENKGRYNIILKTTVTKTDHYRCVSTQEEINHEVYTQTYVPVPGAAAEPVITLHQANEGVLLQCEVQGAFPKPKVVWKDRAGKILPAEEPEVTENKGRYNIILKTTVTKTDYYRCVSTQEEIHHEVSTETYVPVPGGLTAGPTSHLMVSL